MSSGPLRIRRVARYRKARYPSRHPAARTRRPLGRAALRAASVPAAALALGAGGCLESAPDEPPADAADAGDDADRDDGWYESADISGVEIADDALNDLLRLTELEGRAVIRAAIEEASLEDTDPCAVPTLAERLNEDRTFEVANLAGDVVGTIEVDLLAPQDVIPETDECAQRVRPAIGFEFAVEESGDDEDRSGAAEGLTAAERTALAELRAGGKAAIKVLDATNFSYSVPRGYDPAPFRAEPETRLKAVVLLFIADLRRDGMI